MNRKRKNPAPSYTSPIRTQRGCLCDDGTYHPECCDGTLWGQGVGATEAVRVEENFILLENSSYMLQENNYKIKQ
jgi:hypothetical protein